MPVPEVEESEQALIERVRRDPEAFREVFRRMHPRVFAYVAYRVGCAEDAEDITAEVFMRVVRSIERFEYRGDGAFTAWLFQIAYREVARHFSRNRPVQEIPIDDLPDIRASEPTPEQVLARKERFAAVREAILTLPVRRQEVVTLRFFGELRNREIAAVLGLDERTVASHLSRALDQLAAVLQREHTYWMEGER